MAILRAEKLTKIYGRGENQVKALDEVSFSVNRGELVAILGPSGSGKSTLLHLLGGVDRPGSGSVYMGKNDIFAMNDTKLAVFRRRHIGLVYQFYNLIPILNVEENILLPLLLDGKKPDLAFLEEMMGILGLTERREHLPGQLSGGQQQRVSIARALITRPDIILADEPTGNLDQHNTKEIMRLLIKMSRRYGQTILMITHDQKLARATDRILYLEDGRLSQPIRKENA